MPTIVLVMGLPVTAESPRIARLTASQVHAMLSAGILRDGEPLELIDGVLTYKDRSASGGDPMTIGEKHNLAVQLLTLLTADLVTHRVYVQTQGPLRVSPTDEPEPDGAVVRGDPREYLERLPTPADVAAVIEVSDSSLEYDRTSKATLYAKAGIAQYVIVNVRDREIEVYERPTLGRYTLKRIVAANESLDLRVSASASAPVSAARLLP